MNGEKNAANKFKNRKTIENLKNGVDKRLITNAKSYGHKSNLLFTDTKDITYGIETNHDYKNFYKDKNKFVLSRKFNFLLAKQTNW